MKNSFEKQTSLIIELLENANPDNWSQPWINAELPPFNPITKTIYDGINFIYLSLDFDKNKYPTNNWLTFKQATALKGKIKKGSKAKDIVFYQITYINRTTKQRLTRNQFFSLTPEQRKDFDSLPIFKTYYVFNVAEIENLPSEFYELYKVELKQHEKIEKAEALIQNIKGLNLIHEQQNKAYYSLSKDSITMPLMGQFKENQDYYLTLFHELGHWSGARHRLNRTSLLEKSKENYALDEMVAELTAVFLGASLGINTPLERSANYLKSWLKALKDEKTPFFRAIGQAKKAGGFILAFSPTLTQNEPISDLNKENSGLISTLAA